MKDKRGGKGNILLVKNLGKKTEEKAADISKWDGKNELKSNWTITKASHQARRKMTR